MPYKTLLLEQSGAVLKVPMNRPEVYNALSRVMRDELDTALERACEDDSVRVIIIAGAGKHFSSGRLCT